MYSCLCTTVTLTTMIIFPITIIIITSLFYIGITATPYCDQQLKQLHIMANNVEQKCTTIKTCCDLYALCFFTKPSAAYQMQCLCEGKWITGNVFYDATTTDGEWTVIQRRVDGTENFNRSWSDYEKGFGNLNGEFWYGLKTINCLTQVGQWELRVDFEFKNNSRSHLHYNKFKVGSASNDYPLAIGGFTGITPTDPFSTYHNGAKFSTYDKDNDNWPNSCADKVNNAEGNGGWWYNDCWTINLNINYNPAQFGSIYLADTWYNPRWMEMKIRPLNHISQ